MKRFALKAVLVSLAMLPAIASAGIFREAGNTYIDLDSSKENVTLPSTWLAKDKSASDNSAYWATEQAAGGLGDGNTYLANNDAAVVKIYNLDPTKKYNFYVEYLSAYNEPWDASAGFSAGSMVDVNGKGSDGNTPLEDNSTYMVYDSEHPDGANQGDVLNSENPASKVRRVQSLFAGDVDLSTLVAKNDGDGKGDYYEVLVSGADGGYRTIIDGISFSEAGEVPEPATMALLAAGGIALLRRKRRKA